MFEKGDKIHLHGGKVVRVRRRGVLPKMRNGPSEGMAIRGFIRAALVDPETGELPSDWHENVITIGGHQAIVRNYFGAAWNSSVNAGGTAAATDMARALYWGIGYQTLSTAQTSDMVSLVGIQSEYGTNSNSSHAIGSRAAVTENAGLQALSGTWSLTQTHQYAATDMSHGASVNALVQHSQRSVSIPGTCLSFATFASSTKGTAQALVDDIGGLSEALLAAA